MTSRSSNQKSTTSRASTTRKARLNDNKKSFEAHNSVAPGSKRKPPEAQNPVSKRSKASVMNKAANVKSDKASKMTKIRKAGKSTNEEPSSNPSKPTASARARGRAPAINSESDEDEAPVPASKASSKAVRRFHDQDIDDESDDREEDNESEDRGEDLDAMDLDEEAPRVIRDGGRKSKRIIGAQVDGDSDLSGTEDGEGPEEYNDEDMLEHDLTSVPATSDGEGLNWDMLEPTPQHKKAASRALKKLNKEVLVSIWICLKRPVVISTNKASGSTGTQPSGSPSDGEADNEADEHDANENWCSRTDIVLQPFTDATRTFKLSLSSQNSHIKRVIKAAQELGTFQILTDTAYCSLDDGIKSIATASLVDAALSLGYDKPLDIADRLQEGDYSKYVAPLTRYVTQRITLERKDLKKGFMATGDGYDYQKPFGHLVMFAYMAAVFFGNTKITRALNAKRDQIFVSSVPEKPQELELPKAMVIMAACVIHALLQDHAYSSDENFPPSGLTTQWKTYLEILEKMEKKSRLTYHRLMHDLYLKASHTVAPATHGLSRQDIINRINWDAFVDEDDDTTEANVGVGSSGAIGNGA
ncbi:hypothetical protein K435DRAFT_810285 [Dendrothele bispora CBS 962.96]|uniref:DUF6532 domain-containing protein n=1 Tax=Dendrothele bispora (strain CBS 962.96) TaxID=1314807 RepID=A0A4S8KVX6_DENBC|nr:hypothetical protein K435DRAFT_810285 [Dendrothele bispora CBS 962.96]